jgi:dTDP-4-dehydrorhamnose reductase
MRRVLILGAGGMLGSAVSEYLMRNSELEVDITIRSNSDPIIAKTSGIPRNLRIFDVLVNDIAELNLNIYDYVVNCIGVIKPVIERIGLEKSLYINGIFPHKLYNACCACNTQMIHITTDCVYDGTLGTNEAYTEVSQITPPDFYGLSKAAGEIGHILIRTSIIGLELKNKYSLVEWFKRNMNSSSLNGFMNHYWNGITTLQYAKIVEYIVLNGLEDLGYFHVNSPNSVTKYELLKLLAKKYNSDVAIEPINSDIRINRKLRSVFNTFDNIEKILDIIPPLEEQIKEM